MITARLTNETGGMKGATLGVDAQGGLGVALGLELGQSGS